MNMHWIDWLILGGLVLLISFLALKTNRYTKSVADFLSASRCAGKYVLGVADGIAGLGAISIVAMFEMFYKAGFTALWWQNLLLPITLIISMTGWVQYRFRQTRAMTMAQFFEMRYGRKFRVFSGLIAFISGVINFAIFPAVGGRFFQYFFGWPNYFVTLAGFEIDLVFMMIMLFLLAFSIWFTFLGGQIAVIVTDFVQGLFCNVVFVMVGIYLLLAFDWSQIGEAVNLAPANASLVNPINTSETDNFNITYFLIAAFGVFFTFMGWQGNQGYNSSARTPHDARMGRVIGVLRGIIQSIPLVLLPICAFTFLHHADYSAAATSAQTVLDSIASNQIRSQLTVTVAISKYLPIGLIGAFASVMFAAFVSTHDTYLHSWGSIFIQDVVLPIRHFILKKDQPLSTRAHLRLLRLSILGVAIFIFLFSLLFNQQQDILMYFALTGTVFLGWVGAAIVGGLYWKKGTPAGAWSAAITGVLLAVAGWYVTYFWDNFQQFALLHFTDTWTAMVNVWPELSGRKFPVNAQIIFFYTMVTSAASYVIASLLSGKSKSINMDRLLHRGKYAVEEAVLPKRGLAVFKMSKYFSLGDKVIFISSTVYVLAMSGLVFLGTIYMLNTEISDTAWLSFWKIFSWMMLGISAVVTLWLGVGGIREVKVMFQNLRTVERNETDDGTVREVFECKDPVPMQDSGR